MHIGVSLPHHAIGPDPVAIRDWTQAADDLGIDQLIVHKHIILPGPGAASRGGLPGMAAGLGKITRLVPNLAPLSLAPQARQDWLCAGVSRRCASRDSRFAQR